MTTLSEQGLCETCGGPGPIVDGTDECAGCHEGSACRDTANAGAALVVLEGAITGALQNTDAHPDDVREVVERVIAENRSYWSRRRTWEDAAAVERRYARERAQAREETG